MLVPFMEFDFNQEKCKLHRDVVKLRKNSINITQDVI